MSDDLAAQLRMFASDLAGPESPLMAAAAEEIERLRTQVKELQNLYAVTKHELWASSLDA